MDKMEEDPSEDFLKTCDDNWYPPLQLVEVDGSMRPSVDALDGTQAFKIVFQ